MELSYQQCLNLHLIQLTNEGKIEEAEKLALGLPQVPCKVFHHFGPGFCIREMHIPAGTFVIGHTHKQALANCFVKGIIKLFVNGVWQELIAPYFFVGTPGRKVAVTIEDCIWQNIIVTNETNINTIEDIFVSKSSQWLEHNALQEVV